MVGSFAGCCARGWRASERSAAEKSDELSPSHSTPLIQDGEIKISDLAYARRELLRRNRGTWVQGSYGSMNRLRTEFLRPSIGVRTSPDSGHEINQRAQWRFVPQ